MDATTLFAVYMSAALLSYLILAMMSFTRRRSSTAEASVTILAPFKNEASILVPSVRSLMAHGYPVVLVDDGSTDNGFELLKKEYRLERSPIFYPQTMLHKPIDTVWVSPVASITVVRKQSNLTKGDANNAGLEVVQTEYVFVTDVDSRIAPDAIPLLAGRITSTGADAVGCALLPLNSPSSYLTTSQWVEYLRTFTLRAGWNRLRILNNVSGAAGMFRTEALRQIGGYRCDTTAEDLSSTFKLHQHGMKIEFEPDAIVYTEVPATWQALASQRRRWARGLLDVLIEYRAPRRFRFTLLLLWLWVFEAVESFIETAGLILITVKAISGHMPLSAWLFLVAGMSATVLISIIAILKSKLPARRKALFLIAGFTEIPILKIPMSLLWRMSGTVYYLTGNTSWESLPRTQFNSTQSEAA